MWSQMTPSGQKETRKKWQRVIDFPSLCQIGWSQLHQETHSEVFCPKKNNFKFKASEVRDDATPLLSTDKHPLFSYKKLITFHFVV